MACLGDPRIDLRAGQLAALAWLRALRHFDLQVAGVREVFGRDAEPAAGDLLDRRPPQRVVQAFWVLAALARVRPAAEPVHRDGERLMSLQRDGTVRHRTGVESLDDLADRLDLVDRHGWPKPLP